MITGASVACCPACRLVQADGGPCLHCGERLVPVGEGLDRLLVAVVRGVGLQSRNPPTGWRDTLEAFATGLGIWGGAVGGLLLTQHPAGLLLGLVAGVVGVKQQRIRLALKRLPLLPGAPSLPPPAEAGTHVGVARLFERQVTAALAQTPCLATSVIVGARRGGGVYLRHVRVAEMWLVTDSGEHILVTGEVWLAPSADDRVLDPVDQVLMAIGVGPAPRLRAIVYEARLHTGQRLEARGAPQRERVPGVGGYRDGEALVLRGVPGRPVWLRALR